jgi:hypothetical protein
VRTFTLVLALLLGSGGAYAFDCAGVKLPSSLVICSDPELMRLADECQEAFSQAVARLDCSAAEGAPRGPDRVGPVLRERLRRPARQGTTEPRVGRDQGLLQTRRPGADRLHPGIRVGRRSKPAFCPERCC